MRKVLLFLLLISCLFSCSEQYTNELKINTQLLDSIVEKYLEFSEHEGFINRPQFRLIIIEFDKCLFNYKVRVTHSSYLFYDREPSYIYYYKSWPCMVYSSLDYIFHNNDRGMYDKIVEKYPPPGIKDLGSYDPKELFLDIVDNKISVDSAHRDYPSGNSQFDPNRQY